MLTAMVAGYYEPNGNEVYAPGTDTYGEYCYGVQDMCNPVPCSFVGHPGGMRMVQNNSSLPVQLQVPSGHLVQQVVDENGTVRHFLLSPPMALPVGPHYNPNAASSAPMGTQYYPYPSAPTYGPPPPHFQPPSHMQPPALSPIPGIIPLPPAASQCNGESPPDELDTSPPPSQVFLTQKDESYQRSTYKFRRKLDSRNRDKLLPLSQSKKDKKIYGYDDPYRMSGSSASGSNASEDEEVTWIFTEYLSNLRPPKVTELSPYSVLVSWKPPDVPVADLEPAVYSSIQQSEIMYEVMLCEKGKEGRYKSVYSGLEHSCTISSLKPATEYYVCVQASMDDIRGSSVKGLTFKTPPVEPEAPQPPRLCARTKNSLTLKWSSNCESPSSKVNYLLEYDEVTKQGYSRTGFVPVYNGPLKQFKVSKLSPATGYKFRLAAMNDKGKSSYSETCCYFTNSDVPSQPSPPTLKQAYINRLHLEWERRAFDDDFNLQIEDENLRHGFLTVYNGRDNHFICSGLRGKTEYKFRLCASNEEGSSPWSKTVSYCTLPDKLSCPGRPVPKGRIHASCFRITWDPPKDSKHTSITKYILEIDRGFGFEAVYTGPETEFFLENLLPGTTYKVRVACISAAGHSPYSDVNSITTAAVSPGKCALPKLQSKPEASFVCLDWAHPEHDGGSAVSEYEVDMTSPDNVTLQVYKGPETSCIVNGLLPGRPYLFQVRAYNRVGAGPFSDPLEVVSGAGPPDAPRNLVAACDSPFSCLLRWEEPLNNGAAITSYQLQWSTDGGEDDESFSELYEGSGLSYQVKGLMPAITYYFKVKAINEAGQGPSSEAVMCKTPAAVPGAISSIDVDVSSNSIYLSWTEPFSNGSEILSYNVELDGVLYNTEDSNPELCIEDLSPETTYSVRVQALNEIGEGAFSETLQVKTLKSPPSPPELECVATSHNFLKLKWNELEEEVTAYTVEMSSKSKSFVPVYHGAGLSCKVNRLQENSLLHFRITASNASGQGPFSEVYTFQTSRAPPPSIKAPKVLSVTDKSCEVEWTGAKQTPGHFSSYQLQMSTISTDSVIVYEGTDTRCTLGNLEPSTQYRLRIAAVRHCEEGDLVGSFSPLVPFATRSEEVSTDDLVAAPQTTLHPSKRTVDDRHFSAALVALFVGMAVLLAVFLEHFFSLSTTA